MERIDGPERPGDRTYSPGPVVLYLDDLEALYERIQHALGGECALSVDVDGLEPTWRAVYTHRVESFAELRGVLGDQLKRGFLLTGADGEFRMDLHPVIGIRVWGEGERGLRAFKIAADALDRKRRWFAPLVVRMPAWKYIALYGTLETCLVLLCGTPTVLRVLLIAALWCVVILFQPEWSPGGLSKLSLVRRHERTILRDITWKIVAPLFVGAALIMFRAWVAGIFGP